MTIYQGDGENTTQPLNCKIKYSMYENYFHYVLISMH